MSRARAGRFVILGLVSVVLFVVVEAFLRTDGSVRRTIGVVFGVLGLTIGAGQAVYWWMRPSQVADARKLGITWGLMAASGGITILLGTAEHDALMLPTAVLTFGLWRLGRRYLRQWKLSLSQES
jgi:hypothetical protein